MESNETKVSVIINSHNGASYLNNSINSVLKQTYENYEIIFWDNCSSDNTSKLIKRFKDKRIKYFSSKIFDNLPTARNKAIQKANSKFIAILDVDDQWHTTKLEKQLKIFQENHNIALVYTNCFLLKKDAFFFKKRIFSKKKLNSGKINKNILQNYRIAHSTIMFNLDKISKKNVYDENYEIINDFILCESISRDQIIYAIQEPLAVLLIHKMSQNYINEDKEVYELERYYNSMSKFDKENTNYLFLLDKINFLKLKRKIEKNSIYDSFKKIIKLKNNYYKINAVINIIFPKFLINLLKNL